jgi:hypothetical protein
VYEEEGRVVVVTVLAALSVFVVFLDLQYLDAERPPSSYQQANAILAPHFSLVQSNNVPTIF